MNKKKKWGVFFMGAGFVKLLIKAFVIEKAYITGGIIGAVGSYFNILGIFAFVIGMVLFMFGIKEPTEKNIEKEFNKITKKRKN
ncbi:MAG: hypothetical protein WC438_03110 [Candidatus Pacearchaeota archaeon]